jgi:hypothetical protein
MRKLFMPRTEKKKAPLIVPPEGNKNKNIGKGRTGRMLGLHCPTELSSKPQNTYRISRADKHG